MPVLTLLAPNVEDTDNQVCLLSGIKRLPIDILKFIQSRAPTFKLKFSKTTKSKYFANTCPKCGVLYGDFFLQDEPGAPFFPENEEDAKSLYLREIPLTRSIEVEAGLSVGVGEMILKYAKRL